MQIDRTSRRILGALLEKRMSTPEQYPLTLNAVVLACNQKSNRDPEMQLEEFLVEGCLKQLRLDGWVSVVERDFGRSTRYAERMTEKLGLAPREAAVLAELLLRGAQTEQELHRRCERMLKMASPEEALAVLQGMAARGLVEHLPRRVGERIARWRHLLTPPGEDAAAPAPSPAASSWVPDSEAVTMPEIPTGAAAAHAAPFVPSQSAPAAAAAAVPSPAASAEIAALRHEVATLRAELAGLREHVARLVGPLTHSDPGAAAPPASPFN